MISRSGVSAILAFGLAVGAEVSVIAAEPDQLKLEFAPEFLKERIWIQRPGLITPPEDQWIEGNTVVIPLQDQSGKRSEVVRVIAYGPGCQLATLEFVPPPAGSADERVECRKLRTIPLRGSIVGVPRPAGMSISVLYQAPWSQAFMKIYDGPVYQTKVAETTVDANGRFELAVPDFANDPVHVRYNQASFSGDAQFAIGGTYEGRSVTFQPQNQPPNSVAAPIQREYLDTIFVALIR